MRKSYLLVLCAALCMSNTAFARHPKVKQYKPAAVATEEAKSTPEAPAPLPGWPEIPQHVLDPNGLTLGGYASAAYNHLSQSRYFTSGVLNRLYDIDENGFILDQIGIILAQQPKVGFGGLFDAFMGRDSFVMAPYGMQPWIDSQNAGVGIQQAFLQYAFPSSFTIMLGKYYALVGYEGVPGPQRPNYSSSLSGFYLQPGTHLGVRTSYMPNADLKLYAGLNDGWDTVRDWVRRKTVELGGVYSTSAYSLSAYWLNGQERATPFTATGPIGLRNLFDVLGSVNISEKLTLVGNYDYAVQNVAALPDGTNGRAVWQGIAGYVLYQFNDKWRTAIRGEYFADNDGFATGVRQNIRELTVTVGYMLCKNFELRGEVRRDQSNQDSFLGQDGESTSPSQQSYALEAVLTF